MNASIMNMRSDSLSKVCRPWSCRRPQTLLRWCPAGWRRWSHLSCQATGPPYSCSLALSQATTLGLTTLRQFTGATVSLQHSLGEIPCGTVESVSWYIYADRDDRFASCNCPLGASALLLHVTIFVTICIYNAVTNEKFNSNMVIII